ncbi:MAG TPA: 4-hydroxy-tetrahydrodipicolinate synthase [Burkholderiaceae bacterium]|nr:4-hydroxy-tetrahydrodipicolinate synthase [Burkholderiaceae bacterium]
MGSSDFSGLWVPLVTPFRDGRVDEAALRRLVRHLSEGGAGGFVACGSTGEAASLSHAEQLAVLDVVVSAGGGKPVLMGLAGTQAPEMLERLRQFAQAGAQAVLVSSPYYLRPSQAGLVAHFQELAEGSPVPLVLYDVPPRTGVTMSLETLRALAAHPNIAAIKDCGGDTEKTRSLVADGRLAVLAGNDDAIFSTLCMGGAGAITASAHVLTPAYAEMVAATRAGQLARARRLFHALTPLTLALFAEPNPSVFKAVLAHQGWLQNELRAPHTAATQEGVARALAALESAERALAD